MGSRVVFVGPPAVGKTVVGRAFAERLGVDFCDTDELIVEKYGSIANIFLVEGEKYFRELEYETVFAVLNNFSGVVSVGGGAVTFPATYKLLEGEFNVFLCAKVATVLPRLLADSGRPLLLGDAQKKWEQLVSAREGLYESLASLTFVVDDFTVTEIVDKLETSFMNGENF